MARRQIAAQRILVSQITSVQLGLWKKISPNGFDLERKNKSNPETREKNKTKQNKTRNLHGIDNVSRSRTKSQLDITSRILSVESSPNAGKHNDIVIVIP